MNQSTGKANAAEDHNAINCFEIFNEMDCSKQSDATEHPTAADRKEIVKNNNNSPTRSKTKDVPTVNTNSKEEESKTIPKLADEKLTKKPNQTKFSPKSNKTSGLPTSKKKPVPRRPLTENSKTTRPVMSKIPELKQMPNASLKNKYNAHSNAQQPKSQLIPCSDSQLSRTKSTVSEVLEPSISKSSDLPNVSNSAKAKDELKMQTARSPASSPVSNIQKRSISNMSARSTQPLTKRENTHTNLRKITSIAGDHRKPPNMEKNNPSKYRSTSPTKTVPPETNLRKMLSAGDRVDYIEKKLEDAQTEFLDEIKNLKEELPENLKCDYKFLSVLRNDEYKLMVKDPAPLMFPADSICDLKEKIKKYIEQFFASLMDDLKDTNESSHINVETAKEKLEQLQILKSNDLLSLIDDLSLSQEECCNAQIVKMQKELLDSKRSLKILEKSLSDLTKQHEEEILHLEKDFKMKANADLGHKDGEIKDLNKKLKMLEKEDKAEKSKLQEELKTSIESYTTLQKKLHSVEQQLMSEKKELKVKNESIKKLEIKLAEMQKLENNLADMTSKVQEFKDNPETLSNCTEQQQQISELQNVVYSLETEKLSMEQKTEVLEAKVASLLLVQAKLKDAENCIQDLQKKLDTKDKSQDTEADYAKEVQMEFARFRQADAEKRREIEKLKVELSKFQFNMCQMEEEIQRGQQLLEVRCELINSLQTNEKTQRIHMEELFAQVAEKNNAINELNSELRTKSEEFRNLFSTISAKQMELSNQEHMIKLLEDSNERSQMLRVKQEEKIGRMEEELAHLKQTIAVYQANILSGKRGKNVLYAPLLPANNGDFNENFYYYASQRKRKRQVDINVKKYEA